jgi:hypothetical protein
MRWSVARLGQREGRGGSPMDHALRKASGRATHNPLRLGNPPFVNKLPVTHPGLLRAMAFTLVGLCLVGCNDAPPPATARPLAAIDTPITANDLALFLAVVKSHPKKQVPEFAQLDSIPPVDDTLAGPDLAAEYRQRLRRLFDPRVQGEQLANDPVWSGLLRQRQLDPAQFASLVLRLSCAVTRHQLAARHDLPRLSQSAEARIAAHLADIQKTDATPPAQWTNELTFSRTRSVVQLSQAAALAEFARLLESVPAPTRDIVDKHFDAIRPLIPAESGEQAFAELAELSRTTRQ